MHKNLLLTLLFSVLIINSCNQKQESAYQKDVPETVVELLEKPIKLGDEIIETPPSPLSVMAAIECVFREPIVPQHVTGTVLDKSPFIFEPGIKGSAVWSSTTRLRFQPGQPLKAGTQFHVTLDGKIAFGNRRTVDNYSFSFKTAEQEIINFSGDLEPDTSGKNLVKFKGTITFVQPVDLLKITRELRIKGPGGKIEFSLHPHKHNSNEIQVLTESLERKNKGYSISFSLPKKYTIGDNSWEKEVYIPEAMAFNVLAHMDMSDPQSAQRTYGFRFSDPIRSDIDLSGFVSVGNDSLDYKLSIDGKYLKLRGDFLPGASYSIRIAAGFQSALGTKTSDEYVADFSFANLDPQIQWLSEGVYLPSSNQFKLQCESVNVSRIYVTVYEIFKQNVGFFLQRNSLSDKGGNGSSYYYDEYEGSYGSQGRVSYGELDRVGEQIFTKDFKVTQTSNTWVKSEFDLSKVFADKRNSAFIVKIRFGSTDLCGKCIQNRNELRPGDLYYENDNYYNSPCREGYYYRNGTIQKLLISSDIGLTIKKARDGIHVFATDIVKAQPARGLALGLYTFQNKLVQKEQTDINGHVKFELADAAYIKTEDQDGLVVMKIDHTPWETNIFDIAGVNEGQSGLNVFMYTDRGVHRPGDTVNFAAIIRNNRQSPPEEQPVLLQVRNPNDQVVHTAKKVCGKSGLVYFPIPTDLSDPTGSWNARLDIGGKYFHKQLKIENIKPNRFKVEISIPDTVFDKSITGTLKARYLFGTPAAQCPASMEFRFDSKDFSSTAFPDYIFSHPELSYAQRTISAFERQALSTDGERSMTVEVPDYKAVPGILSALVTATVYEKGGSFTRQSKQVTVVPYKAFVGLKAPFRSSNARVGDKYDIPIVVVDSQGKAVAGHQLKLRWYVNRKYWWWDYDRRGKQSFRSQSNTYKIADITYKSESQPLIHRMELEDQGLHLIEITDETTGHTSGLFFNASSWGQSEVVSEKRERNYLDISSDKNVYYPTDQAKISFNSPQEGMALVTIEQSDKILRQDIIRLTQKQTNYKFFITESMVPNCYAVVSLLQPQSKRSNDMPLRTYGIKTINVENPSTRLPLTVVAPDELKPNQKFSVKVTSHSPKPATFTVAIVDEGLLDLTGFETPDPWSYYFQKIRLGIATRDNYDEIIGILLPDMDKFFSIGGGEEARLKRAGEQKVQRFKPVVLFQEPVTVQPGKTHTASFTMHNYVGSVRMMVVGCADNSYSATEKTIAVRQPLMILTTVPRVARPLDQFALPVSIFNMDKSVGDVTLNMSLSGNLKAQGPLSIVMPFSEPAEKDTAFGIIVGETIGEATITISASSANHKTFDKVTLPVGAPNPFFTDVLDTMISSGGSITLIPQKVGIKGTNKASIAVSRMPDIQLQKRAADLIRYPYGCLEQTVSSAFPQLYLGNLVDLTPVQKQSSTDFINAAISRLQDFTMPQGFSYWPGSSWHKPSYSNWGSNYAGHFLIEAKAAGYHVPDNLMKHWFYYASREAKTVHRENHRYQSYLLFLLSLAGKPNTGAMNLLRENYLAELDPLSRRMLATAYFLAGKDPKPVLAGAPTEITTYRELSGTFGSTLRDMALVAYCAEKMDDQKTAAKVLRSIAAKFRPNGWYSTQETAMTLLALSNSFGKSTKTGGDIPFTIKIEGQKEQNLKCKGYQTVIDVSKAFGSEIKVLTSSKNTLFVTLYSEGIPLHNPIKTENQGLELTRNFYDNEGRPVTIEQLGQGTPFWIRYRVRSTTGEQLKELALSSMIPSGWEIINLRLEGIENPLWVQNINVTDGKYMDIRDDRVNWFFDLHSGEANFVVKLNASFRGTFRLPPVSVEAMYSPEYYARIEGGVVRVR